MWMSEPDDETRRERVGAAARWHQSSEPDSMETLVASFEVPAVVVRVSNGKIEAANDAWRKQSHHSSSITAAVSDVHRILRRAHPPPLGYEWRYLGADRMLVVRRTNVRTTAAPARLRSWTRLPFWAAQRRSTNSRTRALTRAAATGLEMLEATFERVAIRPWRMPPKAMLDAAPERRAAEKRYFLNTLVALGSLARDSASSDALTARIVESLRDGLNLAACAALSDQGTNESPALVDFSVRAAVGDVESVESLRARQSTRQATETANAFVEAEDDGQFFHVRISSARPSLIIVGERKKPSSLPVIELQEWMSAIGRSIAQSFDFVESRAAQEHTRALLSSALNAIPDAVVVTDDSGCIREANDEGHAMLRQAGLDIGHDLRARFSSLGLRDCERKNGVFEDAVSRALAGQSVVERAWYEDRETRKRQDVAVHVRPLRQSDGSLNGALLFIQDLAPSHELERLKESFVSMAAHELRTPLATVKALAQGALRDSDQAASVEHAHQSLKGISKQTLKMERLVNDLLDTSRLCNGRLALERRAFELSRCVREIVSQMATLTSSHRFDVQAAQPVSVWADESRIEQVLLNLLTNAVRYSPGGGAITLTVRQDTSWAIVEVADEGVGISSHQLEKIFERFHQGHAQTRLGQNGLGLGLWICNELVAIHDGRIEVESNENKGSTFRVYLPLDGAIARVRPKT